MILAGIYRSIEVGFCWSGRLATFCIFSCDLMHKVALIVKFITFLVILDDLDVLLLIWLGFDLQGLEIFGMKFFVFS